MKSLLFCGKVKNKNVNRDENLRRVGLNSGNLLFWYALLNILDVDAYTQQECTAGTIGIDQYSSFVTTELIWIRPNCEYRHVWKQLELADDRPLVPISVGLQHYKYEPEFPIHPDTVKLLEAIQERCVLGVRGYYSAEILNKHGIKNISVIGCPSLYLPFDPSFEIRKKNMSPKRVSVNMRSMYSMLNEHEIDFLKYAADLSYDFCEQTSHPMSLDICENKELYGQFNEWLNLHKMMFFDVDDWRSFASTQDFSMGGRFHGNVISLWEKVPALFFIVDSRTAEMCEFFSLPTMKMAEFDPLKDIQYYYDRADYSEFNKNYSKNLNTFIDFLKKNKLPIAKRIDGWYDSKIFELETQVNSLLEKKRRLFFSKNC